MLLFPTQIRVMLLVPLFMQGNVPDVRTVISVQAYRSIDAIPGDLHSNARLFDDAFMIIAVEYLSAITIYSHVLV
jgi:hypothetical protein